MGITFGWVDDRTGSVLLCIVGHSLPNCVARLSTVHVKNGTGTLNTPVLSVWIYLAALIPLILGISLVNRAAPPAPPAKSSAFTHSRGDLERHLNPAVP